MLRTIHRDGTVVELSDDLAKTMYTPEQLAVRLQISRNKAYDLIRNGDINYCCVGNSYRVGEPAVQRYQEGLKQLAA